MTTILDDDLNHLLEELSLNKDLFKTSNDEPTPLELCNEMIECIPHEWWKQKRDSFKILDPCTGFGNFMICLFKKLQNHYNLSLIHI